MDFVLNRNYSLATGTGHIVDFVKGQPVYVPEEMHKAALVIGAEAVGVKMNVLDEEPVAKQVPQGLARESAISDAIIILVEENNPKDFTANGRPNIKRIEALIGFDITTEERDTFWAKHKAGE